MILLSRTFDSSDVCRATQVYHAGGCLENLVVREDLGRGGGPREEPAGALRDRPHLYDFFKAVRNIVC